MASGAWQNIDEPVVPSEKDLYGHALAGLLFKRQFESVLLKNGCKKAPTW